MTKPKCSESYQRRDTLSNHEENEHMRFGKGLRLTLIQRLKVVDQNRVFDRF